MIETEPPPNVTATVARHFSLWPFGTRTMRLHVVIDPSRMPPALQRGVLRAAQQAFIRSETGSLTNAVRAAVQAAHYVLQHHNYDVLPQDHATAAAAVAATRGGTAYVALVGDAAAFTWHDGVLSGQRTGARCARPLGLEHEPRITLWSSPLRQGDRLVLVCGGKWPDDAATVIRDILRDHPTEVAEHELAEALSARVVVSDGSNSVEHTPTRNKAAPRPTIAWRRWLLPLVPLSAMSISAVAALGSSGEPQHIALAQQAEVLLDQAHQSPDVYQAHALAATARDFAQRAESLAPTHYSPLVANTAHILDLIDRVYPVQPLQSVRFGPMGNNVVDLAVGADGLYTLDVVEAAVRRFSVDGLDQQPTPETLLIRRGAAIGDRWLDSPVAMQFLPGAGALTIVDRSRAVFQISAEGAAAVRALPSSAEWQRLGALGASAEGHLYVLDSGSGRLLEYSAAGQRLVDPPRPVFDASSVTNVAFDQVAEVLAVRDVYVRFDDGRVRRFSRDGHELNFVLQPPDARPSAIAAIASDRAGGLYLADPGHARIVHTTADGDFVRQLRNPALAGVRQLQASLDGLRLYALVPSGVLVFDLPIEIPAPVPGSEPDTVEEPLTPLSK